MAPLWMNELSLKKLTFGLKSPQDIHQSIPVYLLTFSCLQFIIFDIFYRYTIFDRFQLSLILHKIYIQKSLSLKKIIGSHIYLVFILSETLTWKFGQFF